MCIYISMYAWICVCVCVCMKFKKHLRLCVLVHKLLSQTIMLINYVNFTKLFRINWPQITP